MCYSPLGQFPWGLLFGLSLGTSLVDFACDLPWGLPRGLPLGLPLRRLLRLSLGLPFGLPLGLSLGLPLEPLVSSLGTETSLGTSLGTFLGTPSHIWRPPNLARRPLDEAGCLEAGASKVQESLRGGTAPSGVWVPAPPVHNRGREGASSSIIDISGNIKNS